VTALVTGGFHVFADPIARRLGFDHVFANRIEIDGDRLTGKALAPVLDRTAKRTTLLSLCEELGIRPQQAIAIGDGANDLAMIETAGLGIAYHAKPTVSQAANARIDHTGLDTVLDFLGG
jgi:phosphoserine phosphatase